MEATSVTSSMKSASTFLTKIKDSLPQSPMMWIVALTCVVLLVTLSRMLALQRSIQDLQSKPSVDESVVRQLVRQQLEETVKSIEQQNKAHMQMQAMRAQDAARQAAEARKTAVNVEVVEAKPEPEKAEPEVKAEPVQPEVKAEPVKAEVKAEPVKAELDEKLDDEVVDEPKETRRRKK